MQYSNFHKVGLKQLLCNWTIPGKIAPSPQRLKGILHPKFLILSSFTHPQVVGNLYEFLFSAEHKGRYFEERFEPKSCLAPSRKKKKYYGSQWCQSSNRSSKYLPLCSAEERNSYRFAAT